MAKKYYYALVTKKGSFITTDHKLPIYWRKDVAEKDAILFGAKLARLSIEFLNSIIIEK